LLLSACGSSGGSETLIGYPCDNADECDVTGVCVKDGKDGMCTQKCISPGGAGQCPYGTYCTRGEFTSDQGEAVMTLCFPACKEQRECRDGYECNGVSSGPGKVCQPKKP
jgi:hypothetical protein